MCVWPGMPQLPKKVRDKVDFLYADKPQIFLEGDAIIFDVYDKPCSK